MKRIVSIVVLIGFFLVGSLITPGCTPSPPEGGGGATPEQAMTLFRKGMKNENYKQVLRMIQEKDRHLFAGTFYGITESFVEIVEHVSQDKAREVERKFQKLNEKHGLTGRIEELKRLNDIHARYTPSPPADKVRSKYNDFLKDVDLPEYLNDFISLSKEIRAYLKSLTDLTEEEKTWTQPRTHGPVPHEVYSTFSIDWIQQFEDRATAHIKFDAVRGDGTKETVESKFRLKKIGDGWFINYASSQ